jgi:arylesterase/paraoxonase
LGLGFWPESRTLYNINHGEHPAGIEVFAVDDEVSKLTYKRTITHPLMRTPNSVLPISDHEIYFTNDHHYEVRNNPVLSRLENYLKIAKGNVVYMNLKTNEARIVAQLGFANGIARLNATHLAIASTTSLSVFIYEIQADRSIDQLQRIYCNFWVDNLKADGNGKLLISGHPHAPLVEKVAKNQHKYRLDRGRTEGLDPEERPRAPSWVAEWDGNSEGKLKHLFVSNDYGLSTSTVRDVKRNVGFVVGLYERGILQFEE